MTAHGVRDASTDPEQLAAWSKRWPDANIGLDCGGAGLLVLDFDAAKPDYAGADLLNTLLDLYPTVTARTGGGGFHLLYRQPEGARLGCSRGGLPTGVDVRGQGGYVVLAPSLHPSGNRYEWLAGHGPQEFPPAPLPAFVLDLLRGRAHRQAQATGGDMDAADLLARAVLEGTPGNRNQAGFFLALRLRDSGLTQEQAQPVMLAYQAIVQHTGDHAYTEREALASLASAYSRLPKRPAAHKPVHDLLDQLERVVVGGAIDLPANVERTMMGVLSIFHSAQSVTDVHMAIGDVAHRANMPRATVARHLKVLCERGLLLLVKRSNHTAANVYNLGPEACAKVRHPFGGMAGSAQRGVSLWQSGDAVTVYRQLQEMPITEPGARVHFRLAANADELTWSFGASAHRLLLALAQGPAADVAELAERARVSLRTTYRKLHSLQAAGVVVAGPDLSLSADWQARIADFAPALTTWGRHELRAVSYAKQRIALHSHMLEVYESRPLRRAHELAGIAWAALERAQADLAHWQCFAQEVNLQRLDWAREHLDISADAVPPCSLRSDTERPRPVQQPVAARGRKVIPTGRPSAKDKAAALAAWGMVGQSSDFKGVTHDLL